MEKIILENVKVALLHSNSKADILRWLGVSINGSNHNKLNYLIGLHNLDLSGFDIKSKQRKYPIITKICPVCGVSFETKQGHKSEKTTCSHACANTYFRSGEDNPNYKDFSEYTDKQDRYLSKKYRKKCFEHHEHKCVVCGEEKILDVHHYDENKFNNEPENLIPLCPTHHGYFHSKYRDEVVDRINGYHKLFNKTSVDQG